MKIDFKGGLIVLLFLALCLTNIIQCNEEKRIPTTDIPYHTLDSLGRVISALENYAIKQERLIDSLKANTNKIIIKYFLFIVSLINLHYFRFHSFNCTYNNNICSSFNY